MESNQEDIIDELSTKRDADGSLVDEDQNSQNPPLEELINLVSSQPTSSNISTIKRGCPPARGNDNDKAITRLALWHYLRDHGEDMKKWHKKPTSVLQARIKELQDRSTTKVKSSKRVIAPVAVDNQRNK